MQNSGKADRVIQEGGCGLFQILLVIFVKVMPEIGTAYTMMFMAFGNYDPGWRCLDNNGTKNLMEGNITQDIYKIHSSEYNETSNNYTKGSCELFKGCQNIEFDPEASTIVTEWGLLCDRSWVPSLIISAQMAGVIVGALAAGQLGDSFGRKKILYFPLALAGILNITAIFSMYWQVYLVLRFLLGLMVACIYNYMNTYSSEFLTTKWRARVVAIPSWNGGGILLGVTAWLSKDWKTMHLMNGLYFIIACLPALWVPESLRWLEVKNKSKEFQKAVEKITGVNKVTLLSECTDQSTELKNTQTHLWVKGQRVHTVFDLFRKGYRLTTCIIGFIWFSGMLLVYGFVYSIKAMYGSFYVNLIVFFVVDYAYAAFPMILPNWIGRKKSTMLFMSVAALSLFAATGLGFWAPAGIRNTGAVILALFAKMNVASTVMCAIILTSETFPTVVRGNAMGFGNFIGRLGAVMAPILIPDDTHGLFVRYGIMGTLSLLCCLLVIKLPETKGMKIKEVFEDDETVERSSL